MHSQGLFYHAGHFYQPLNLPCKFPNSYGILATVTQYTTICSWSNRIIRNFQIVMITLLCFESNS